MFALISAIVPFLFFAICALGTSILLKKSFGRVLPLVMISVSILMFLSQVIMGTFWVGFSICIGYSLFALFLLVRYLVKNGFGCFKKNLVGSGLIAFSVIYLLVMIYDFGRGFSVWDEFSHWGMMLKEMFRLDKFYFVDESNLLVHKDYPPALQLFELFWIRICGNFSDNNALKAVHCFELSLIVPLLVEFLPEKKSTFIKTLTSFLLAIFATLFVLTFDLHGVIHSIYNDYAMALVVVFLSLNIIIERKIDYYSILCLVLVGAFLVLLKQMGLPLYLMTLTLFAGLLLIRNGLKARGVLKKYGLRNCVIALVALAAPFALWLVWNRLTKSVAHQFDYSDLAVGDLFGIIAGSRGESWQRLIIKKFLIALECDSIATLIVPITFVGVIVLTICGIWYLVSRHRGNYDKKEMIFLGGLLGLGAIGYSAAMLVLYVFSFGEFEGTILASYERYMGTFAIIMLGIVVALIGMPYLSKTNLRIVASGCLLLFFTVTPSNFVRILPSPVGAGHREISSLANDIKNTIPADSKVFLVYQEPIGFYYFFQYFATPLSVNATDYTWPVDEEIDPDDYYQEKILPLMANYDYLLIYNYDDNFLSNYCDKICPKEEKTLYKVNKSGGSIEYELVKTY